MNWCKWGIHDWETTREKYFWGIIDFNPIYKLKNRKCVLCGKEDNQVDKALAGKMTRRDYRVVICAIVLVSLMICLAIHECGGI